MTPHIAILSASVRDNRKSHRTALFFERFIRENDIGTTAMIDLREMDFPLFPERLSKLENPDAKLLAYSKSIREADGVLIVTPEYNGGYPASLKNAVDVLYDEWYHKPVAISTNSDGIFGGMQCITSLQFSLWKIRAFTVPAMFPVQKTHETFGPLGEPAEDKKEGVEKRAKLFVKEFLWCIEAARRMKEK